MSQSTVDISKQDDVTVVALGPEYENLDEERLYGLTDVLLDVAQNVEPPLVVVDLSHTTFFGTAFLGILFRMRNRLKSREGGRFAVSGLTPHCAKVVKVSHLDSVWNTFDARDDAIREFQNR